MKDPFGNEITFASQTQVDRLRENVDKILWAVAPHMGWDDLSDVFVSDRSSIGDFTLEPQELDDVAKKIGVKFDPQEYLYEIALRMDKPQ